MAASTPEQICELFQKHVREGDLASALALYDPEVAFLNRAGRAVRLEGLEQELAPLVAARTEFAFEIQHVVQAGDIALMHTRWTTSQPEPTSMHAVEVARRQRDGSWRWLIGDPFTVDRLTAPR